jgi:WD40 repeat protein
VPASPETGAELDKQPAIIWDVESGRELKKLIGHKCPVTTAAFSPDGKKIVTASYGNDCTIRIWDTNSGEELQKLAEHGAVHSAVFSPNGKMIVTASNVGTRIWVLE